MSALQLLAAALLYDNTSDVITHRLFKEVMGISCSSNLACAMQTHKTSSRQASMHKKGRQRCTQVREADDCEHDHAYNVNWT